MPATPRWTIEQIHPLSGCETLEGETAVLLPFEIYLPHGFRSRREVLKVFGTTDPASFRWLELPATGTHLASRHWISAQVELEVGPVTPPGDRRAALPEGS